MAEEENREAQGDPGSGLGGSMGPDGSGPGLAGSLGPGGSAGLRVCGVVLASLLFQHGNCDSDVVRSWLTSLLLVNC